MAPRRRQATVAAKKVRRAVHQTQPVANTRSRAARRELPAVKWTRLVANKSCWALQPEPGISSFWVAFNKRVEVMSA